MRLCVGLLIALFHKPIADWILHQEMMVVTAVRARGVPYPMPPRRETARNLYFLTGMGVAIIQLARIWTLFH